MPPTTSLRSITDRDFGYAEAQHLLSRAGFGGTPQQIAQLQAMGIDKAVDYLVDYEDVSVDDLAKPTYDADLIRPPTEEERELIRRAERENNEELRERYRREFLRRRGEDRNQMTQLKDWWLARMIATPRPLEERLVLFWHSHFATNHRTVQDSFLLLKQNVLFRKHANGNFANMVYGIIRDPAMIRFLNNDSNRKRSPNENLARELMELFTLGEGNYTETDIKEGARALTGYTANDNVFQLDEYQHDTDTKEIFGKKASYNGEQFVDAILARPVCSLFVCLKLYKYFVADVSDIVPPYARTVVTSLADTFRDGKYAMKPVLKRLFKSEHFYDAALRGQMVKGPAQHVVGSVRVLGTPTRDISVLSQAMRMMGQDLFDPPSVAGWDGGRGWVNTSTLYVRQNLTVYLLTGKLPYSDGWSREEVDYDPMFLIADLKERSPRTVVTHLLATLIGKPIAAERQQALVDFLDGRDVGITRDSMLALLLLITALPEYQLT